MIGIAKKCTANCVLCTYRTFRFSDDTSQLFPVWQLLYAVLIAESLHSTVWVHVIFLSILVSAVVWLDGLDYIFKVHFDWGFLHF